MREILETFGSWVSAISSKLHFGQTASIAATILCIIVAFLLVGVVWKFLKKRVGTFLMLLLVVAILLGAGVLSLSQFKNFAEAAGIIYKDGLPEGAESDGSWILEMIDKNAPGKDEGAGTWVPDKNNPDKW